MASSSSQPTLRSLFGTPYTYVATVVLLFAAVIGAFALHIVPSFVGYVGLATGLLALAAFLAQDLSGESIPAGWPNWTTFVVIVVIGGLEAGIGYATSTTFLTLAGIIGLVVFVTQWIVNALNQDQGANIPLSTEMQVVALLGILITALTSLSGTTVATASINATNATAGAVVTTFAALGGYLFSKEKSAARARAASGSATH